MNELPEFCLYWLGEPSQYNPKDKVLKPFLRGDLGGRYIALKADHPPKQLFDSTFPLVLALYKRGAQTTQLTGQVSPEVVFADAFRMTWVFASQEISKLQARIAKLEQALEAKKEPPHDT